MKIEIKISKAVSEIDKKIDSLTPGGSVELSRGLDVKVMAERSGNGERLTIYRETTTGFEVIKRESF